MWYNQHKEGGGMLVYCVEIPKTVHCPKWDIDIVLLGKYDLSNGIESSIGNLRKAKRPIAENNNLRLCDQQKEYKLLRCLEYLQCPLLSDFPKTVDTHKITRIE